MPAPSPVEPIELQVALMRQASEQQHGVLLDGQRRIESSVGALRDEVAKTYVDKVEFGKVESRVRVAEERIVAVDGRVTTQSGYLGWGVKSIIGLVMTALAGLLFAKGGMHP